MQKSIFLLHSYLHTFISISTFHIYFLHFSFWLSSVHGNIKWTKRKRKRKEMRNTSTEIIPSLCNTWSNNNNHTFIAYFIHNKALNCMLELCKLYKFYIEILYVGRWVLYQFVYVFTPFIFLIRHAVHAVHSVKHVTHVFFSFSLSLFLHQIGIFSYVVHWMSTSESVKKRKKCQQNSTAK